MMKYMVRLNPYQLHIEKLHCRICNDMEVSSNGGTPKSSMFIGFSIINHAFWGIPIYGTPYGFSAGPCLMRPQAPNFAELQRQRARCKAARREPWRKVGRVWKWGCTTQDLRLFQWRKWWWTSDWLLLMNYFFWWIFRENGDELW